ncbi:hypothetical protein H0H81_005385 [Sphagnurus paluster]|uniref:Uncharacterized protein n=1 Tax=Sphagnurus paluster TaxID=117069 RepID=A0A9P7KJ17_9AGAR|nr:hypothetical protein H0H81_005385 [Sphagnurus paluster]
MTTAYDPAKGPPAPIDESNFYIPMVNARPISARPQSSTSSRAQSIARTRSASVSEAPRMHDRSNSNSPNANTPTPTRPASPFYAHLPTSDDQDMDDPFQHAANLFRTAIASSDQESAPRAFETTLGILGELILSDYKGQIYINRILHRDIGEDAAAALALIISTITPLFSKMAENNASLDHSNPDIASFLHLAGVKSNINKFKDPNDEAILSLQNEVQRLKSVITDKDNHIGALVAQIQKLQLENKKLGKKPAAQSEPTPPASDDILNQILNSLTTLHKRIEILENPNSDKSLGTSIHAPKTTPSPPNKTTPTPLPTPQVWVPNHTLRLKGEFIHANFPGGIPHPLVTSSQYPKGHPSCYEPIPPPTNTKSGSAVLPKFPPEVTSAQGGKTKGKGKGKGKATLGPTSSQAESSNVGKNAPPPPPTPSFFEGLCPMPASWDKEVEYATTQGAANLMANLPPPHVNPAPPAEYINPPIAPTFASKAKAATNIPQPKAASQTKSKTANRPKPKVVNARNDVRYQLLFKDKSRVTNINDRPSTFHLVATFNAALKERIPAELVKEHPSLKGPSGVVSRANWSASNNIAVWLHEAVTHVSFPGLSNIMVTAAQSLNITGSSIPEFKRFSPMLQFFLSSPLVRTSDRCHTHGLTPVPLSVHQ